MSKKIAVPKGQAYFRFKFLTTDTGIDLQGGKEPKGMISADLAYRIYKMLLDDQGKTKEPNLDDIFGPKGDESAVPEYPASVVKTKKRARR